jgi:hypothetical protein
MFFLKQFKNKALVFGEGFRFKILYQTAESQKTIANAYLTLIIFTVVLLFF